MSRTITVNRAPVLTLWAAVVAERIGYEWDEALSLGKAVAGLTAQSKGQHLGIYAKSDDAEKAAKKKRLGEHQFVELCGRNVPARRTKDGMRAMSGADEVDSESVQRYVIKSFGDNLEAVVAAMRKLASAHTKDDLQQKAFGLYEQFRPAVDYGVRGWGQKGKLDIDKIARLRPG
ncbi:MAG: hypothetical protein HUU46_22145 [Candidatus Hydrogenedentes bacterium]|nr:hypothetical protein [Candidatus Hydrogenedentota bacterium]